MKGHLLKYLKENIEYFPEHLNVLYKQINNENKIRMGKHMFILHTKETQILTFFHTTGEYMKRSATLLLIGQKHLYLNKEQCLCILVRV